METTIEKIDLEIMTDVMTELEFEPSVTITNLVVLVKEGVVTLHGFASNYGEKCDARKSAKRITGVKAVNDQIIVKLSHSHKRTDSDIMEEIARLFQWSTKIPPGSVDVKVHKGKITLIGHLEWGYQKEAAESAVQYLMGVQDLSNRIIISPKWPHPEVATAIQPAFQRNALLEAETIHVETFGNQVILRGKVRNHSEREEAERVAWASAGVFSVENNIKVEWPWRSQD